MWNADIEVAFFKKLARARDKAQYLKIQAGLLRTSHPKVSLMLLERYFALDENFWNAPVYEIQADACKALGDFEGACAALEKALLRVTEFPGVGCGAALSLPVLIATERMTSLYARGFELLTLERGPFVFPVQSYYWHGANALLLYETGRLCSASVL